MVYTVGALFSKEYRREPLFQKKLVVFLSLGQEIK